MQFHYKSEYLDIQIGNPETRIDYSKLAKDFDIMLRKLLTKSPDSFYQLYDACDRLASSKGVSKVQTEKILRYFELQAEIEEIQASIEK